MYRLEQGGSGYPFSNRETGMVKFHKSGVWIYAVILGILIPCILLSAEEVIPIDQPGYIKFTVGADQQDLISFPFIAMGDSNEVTNMFPTVGIDCEVYFWDSGLQVWTAYASGAKGSPLPSRKVESGESFFVHSDVEQEFTLTGILPSPPLTNTVTSDPCMLAYPYPINTLWTNTQVSALLPEGSIVSFWNMESNHWGPSFFKAATAKGGGWGNTANNYTIPAGYGFAIQQGPNGSNFSWVEYNTNFNWVR